MKTRNFTLITAKITMVVVITFLNGLVWAQNEKITICHCPPGNPNNCHTITISINAWAAHLENHPGDHVGTCDGDDSNRKLVEVVASPNPSAGQTTITYDLSEESQVNIDVYNAMGYKVQTIVSDTKQAGTYTADFDASNTGVYLVNVTAVTPYEAVQSNQTIITVN